MVSKKDDWFERQIESIAITLLGLIFGKKRLQEILHDRQENEGNDLTVKANEEFLARVLEKMVREKKFQDADELLKEEIEKNPTARKLEIASKFYDELDHMDEQTLSEDDYTKEKIRESIKFIRDIYLPPSNESDEGEEDDEEENEE